MKYKQIKIEPVPDTTTVRVTEPYKFRVLASVYTIPVGFTFDGASIPRIFWSLTYSPFHPKVITGACVHDYLYKHGLTARRYADELAVKVWADHGVDKIRRACMWAAIRLFGRKRFNNG